MRPIVLAPQPFHFDVLVDDDPRSILSQVFHHVIQVEHDGLQTVCLRLKTSSCRVKPRVHASDACRFPPGVPAIYYLAEGRTNQLSG